MARVVELSRSPEIAQGLLQPIEEVAAHRGVREDELELEVRSEAFSRRDRPSYRSSPRPSMSGMAKVARRARG